MSERDPFEYDDAAYVLGALSPEEHAAFEEHLLTCAECRARVELVKPPVEPEVQVRDLASYDIALGVEGGVA